jgi:hypothetical protein
LYSLSLLFSAAAEGFFWDEFNTRFNFIAVDYLVYTTEVIGNARQSYPVEWIVVLILTLSFFVTFALRNFIYNYGHVPISFWKRTPWFLSYLSIPVVSFILVDSRLHHFSNNTYANELAGNGLYELFAAYRNNELDYDQFYPHAPENMLTRIFSKCFICPSDLLPNL